MPNINDVFKSSIDILTSAGIDSALFDARELLLFSLGCPDLPALLRREQMTQSEAERFFSLVDRRAQRFPLQYILGFWEFYGRRFVVREGVLIPRPDTEILVEEALLAIRAHPTPRILDLCSGSGVIAVTLVLEHSGAVADAVELSPKALGILKENIALHRARVSPIAADALSFEPTGVYDIILSNPPYVTEEEYPFLQPEVLCEPKMALTAPCGGLQFYESFIRRLPGALAPGGKMLFECGATQAKAVKRLFLENGYRDVAIKKDYANYERVLLATAP